MSAPYEIERPTAPFRGIEEFRFLDQTIFPGREAEQERLIRLITLYRGVLLYGDSGVGKSSLVNAGLIPTAIKEGFAPERIRVDPRGGAEFIVERISLAADDEAPYLPSRFARNEKSRRVALTAQQFEENIRKQQKADSGYPLLILDQFEEVLTLDQSRARAHSAGSETPQARIVKVLLDILADETIPVKIIFVFREDFLAKLSKIFRRHPNLVDQCLRVDPLSIDQFTAIVSKPFITGVFKRVLADDVIRDLERQFRERAESSVLNLSEVQIAALRLWESNTPRELLTKRGVGGLIEDYFAEAIDRLQKLQQPAVLLLNRMVTYSDTRNVVTRDDLLHDVAAEEKVPEGELKKALEALEKGRVVRGEKRNNVVVYEIVSEYLVPWIVRKRTELAAEKRRRETIEQANRAYVEEIEHREQLRWKRTVRVYQAAVITAIVLVIAGIIYNMLNTNHAKQKKLDEALATIDHLEGDIKRLENERLAQESKLEKQRTELTETKSRFEQIRRGLDDLNTSHVDLQRRLAVATEARMAAERRVTELTAEVARLKKLIPPGPSSGPASAGPPAQFP